ncbi:signal recognition particle [Steroidobacter denitrificans]|uniref:Signal recognition particle protein n=1 Tax=Steroidobacter denitrificans TaxID=465721 RepID=A0A127F7R3_STEDE|nr:signal recognition particle protein [Steroidobacter denitrificans]AMN46486.1 signal recognition particle [Steroidobacter denitrificans]
MFDKLSERLQGVMESLRGRGRLTDENISDTLRQVRMALLEADVALPVVKTFVESIRTKVVGQEIDKSLTPGQTLIRIINDELIALMGAGVRPLNLRAQPPVVILLAGLQGAGKTTSAAKLAKWLKDHERKRVLLASTDVYRPAAILQLERLATQLGIGFYPSDPSKPALTLAREALQEARRSLYEVLIVDTAGRLHVDAEMMAEIRAISAEVMPTETLFVVDSMAGQDAVNAARAFGEALSLTGVVLTKTDGDARGGAALSVRQITGQPILFMGTGEKTDALEPFHAERVVSRMLGMGDVLSLVESVSRNVDREQAEKLARKLKKGKGFDLEDLHEQLLQVQKMGGLSALMDKLPAQFAGKAAAAPQANDKEVRRQVAVIRSMTPGERRYPKTIDASRKRRIAAGSGVPVSEVNRLLKSHMQMQKMMKMMGKGGGLGKMMRAFGGGRFPMG